MNDLRTGDILLCDDLGHRGFFGIFATLIKYFTNSQYSHIGMVVKDPTFTEKPLKGVYIWESSWQGKPDPQDGKIKLGVQITPLEQFLDNYRKNGKIFLRRLICKQYDQTFTEEKLTDVHKVVYCKPYDIVITDWLEAWFKRDPWPQKTSRFWCSALIGYIYTSLGLLESSTDWSILAPSFFSTENSDLCLLKDASFGPEEEII